MGGHDFGIASDIFSQVLPDTNPEVYYSGLPPEAINVRSSKNSSSAHVISKKRTKWSFAALTIFFVVALATGLGIGLWKKKSETLSTPSATVRYELRIVMLEHLLTQQAQICRHHHHCNRLLMIYLLPQLSWPMAIDIYSSKALKVLFAE